MPLSDGTRDVSNVSMDADRLLWILSDDLLSILPTSPLKFQLKGHLKRYCNSARLPTNFDLPVEPLSNINRGQAQESYFHQLAMLRRMIMIQLMTVQLLSDQVIEVMRRICRDEEITDDLRCAEAVVAQLSLMFHHFAFVTEKRAVHTVKFITGGSFSLPKTVDKQRHQIDPVNLAKATIKTQKMIREGRSNARPHRGNQQYNQKRPAFRDNRGRYKSTRYEAKNIQVTRDFRRKGRGGRKFSSKQ